MNFKFLAYRGAPASIVESGTDRLYQLIGPKFVSLVQESPDVLFFLTGGSERAAIECLAQDKFVCLIGSQRDNALASAVEVMAYLRNLGRPALLLDEDDPRTPEQLMDLHHVIAGLQRLRGKRLGLIGEVSEWLVSSTIPVGTLRGVLGIQLEKIPWEKLPHYSTKTPDPGLLSEFAPVAAIDLTDTARVATLLHSVIKEKSFDAVTVECFSLVQKNSVTACLPLASFNAAGFPAGCEGDIASAAGMMLGKEITGIVPWMANINKIDTQSCLFSHCTIAPTQLTRKEITTHFETGAGTSIRGEYATDFVTVFRLKNDLTRAFISCGNVTGRPHHENACRTQIEVPLPESAVDCLRRNPLGNHHLIFPGDVVQRLSLASTILGIQADVYR
ncbi:MAG: hypothetical protein NTV54_07770 [Ignavibacteriales bacterium]|nr:hypothetical protein [Ignavibacteriales bacterium]